MTNLSHCERAWPSSWSASAEPTAATPPLQAGTDGTSITAARNASVWSARAIPEACGAQLPVPHLPPPRLARWSPFAGSFAPGPQRKHAPWIGGRYIAGIPVACRPGSRDGNQTAMTPIATRTIPTAGPADAAGGPAPAARRRPGPPGQPRPVHQRYGRLPSRRLRAANRPVGVTSGIRPSASCGARRVVLSAFARAGSCSRARRTGRAPTRCRCGKRFRSRARRRSSSGSRAARP